MNPLHGSNNNQLLPIIMANTAVFITSSMAVLLSYMNLLLTNHSVPVIIHNDLGRLFRLKPTNDLNVKLGRERISMQKYNVLNGAFALRNLSKI